ncbi:MAG: hypothetical protein WKF77_00650 [Planctomycetaceae bacterium]
MKRFCQVITVLAIIVVGLGFYRGWFTLTGGRDAESHQIEVKLSVDTDKVKHDAGAVIPGSKTKDLHNEQ